MKTVRLHLENGEHEVEMNYIPLVSTWVDGNELLNTYKQGCLIERRHRYLQTQLILDYVRPCMILVFDRIGKFVTVKPIYKTYYSPFSILIQERYILLLPNDSDLLKLSIGGIAILEENHKISKLNNSEPPIKRKIVNGMIKTITYSDKEKLPVPQVALITRVESINKIFGKLDKFIVRYKLFEGVTNGKIFILGRNQTTRIHNLNSVMDEIYRPLGFEHGKDYVMIKGNQLYNDTEDRKRYVNRSMPESKYAKWLGSIIDMEANFVWYIGKVGQFI